jgi:hypothetical protein
MLEDQSAYGFFAESRLRAERFDRYILSHASTSFTLANHHLWPR